MNAHNEEQSEKSGGKTPSTKELSDVIEDLYGNPKYPKEGKGLIDRVEALETGLLVRIGKWLKYIFFGLGGLGLLQLGLELVSFIKGI